MSAVTFLSWAVCGLAVGLIARLLIPGRQNMGLLITAGLGVLGAVVGGFVCWYIQRPSGGAFSVADAWPGWIAAILGAVLVVWVYGILHPRRWWQW